MKAIFRILSVLGALAGVLLLAHAAIMWLGGVILAPLSFPFGLGEAGNYATAREGPTNLFWHVVPGVAGIGMSLLSLVIAILLFWGSRSAWRRAD